MVMTITFYLNAIFFRNKRCQYLPKYYYIRPNAIKYHDLFCSTNITLLNNTCKCLDNIMKTFVPPVNLVLLYYICITIVLYCTYCYYVLMHHLLCDLSVNKDMFCSVLFCSVLGRIKASYVMLPLVSSSRQTLEWTLSVYSKCSPHFSWVQYISR